MKKIIYILIVVITAFYSCENQDWEFPDFDYSTVYFAYQSPVRTIVLGQDYGFDNTLDNEYRCRIMATIGGVYGNKNEVTINVEVDNSLCDSLKFGSTSGSDMIAMPSEFYSLSENMQIVIPSGELMGGIDVQLTEAFFADSLSHTTTYVIPLVMNSVTNADSILSGQTEIDTADRRIAGHWSIVPKDYILYAVKYINPWDATYLRRGVEAINDGRTNTYHAKYVEQDEVRSTTTLSRYQVSINLEALNADGTKTPFELILTFDDSNNCSVQNHTSATYTATGSGSYVKDADSWGNKSRDALYLQYNVNFGSSMHSFTDTLVLRDRSIGFETFVPAVAN